MTTIKSPAILDYEPHTLSGLKIGIVTAQWNHAITKKLQEGCQQRLEKAGFLKSQIHHLAVPGTFELPIGVRLLEQCHPMDAVICLGCVIKGETDHDVFISQSTAQTLSNMSVMLTKPIIFGVITTKNEEQALERAGGAKGHKGEEAAETILALLAAKEKLDIKKASIGYHANS